MQEAVRDALIAFMAATTQATGRSDEGGPEGRHIEAALEGKPQAYRGRKPSYSRDQFTMVQDMLAGGAAGTSEIARATMLTRQTVLRIRKDMAEAEAALARWGI